MALTMAFEFVVFHYAGVHSWADLLGNYNLLKGRVWVLLLVWIATAPFLFYSLKYRAWLVEFPKRPCFGAVWRNWTCKKKRHQPLIFRLIYHCIKPLTKTATAKARFHEGVFHKDLFFSSGIRFSG